MATNLHPDSKPWPEMADQQPPQIKRKVTATAKIQTAPVGGGGIALRGTPALRARTRARVLLSSSPGSQTPPPPTTQTTPLHRSPLTRAATTNSPSIIGNQGTPTYTNGLAPRRIAVVRATTSSNVLTSNPNSGSFSASGSGLAIGKAAGKAQSEVGLLGSRASDSMLASSSSSTPVPSGRIQRYAGSNTSASIISTPPPAGPSGTSVGYVNGITRTPSTPTMNTYNYNHTQGQTCSPLPPPHATATTTTTTTTGNVLSFASPHTHPHPPNELRNNDEGGSPLVSPRSGRREAGRVSRGLGAVAASLSHSPLHRRENGSNGNEQQQQQKPTTTTTTNIKFRLKMANSRDAPDSPSYSPMPTPIPVPISIPTITATVASAQSENYKAASVHVSDPGRRQQQTSYPRVSSPSSRDSPPNSAFHESNSDSDPGSGSHSAGSERQAGSAAELESSEEEEDDKRDDGVELPPLVVSAEVRRRIVEEEDAKRSRKIADLEISNQSLMTINRTLEADVARKNRLISGMKRQLRASGQQVAPRGDQEDISEEEENLPAQGNGKKRGTVNGQPRNSRAITRPSSHPHSNVSETSDDEDDISAFLLATRAHSTRLTRLNDHVGSLITRGREAIARVATMQDGGRGKVWGVLELGERDADGEDEVYAQEGAKDEQATGVQFVDGEKQPASQSESDDVDSDSVRDRGAVD